MRRPLFSARFILLLVAIIAASAGCSDNSISTGDLTGDVFLSMKSGDVKRGAGLEILIVAATPQFEDEWGKYAMIDKLERARLVKEYGEARERVAPLEVELNRAKQHLDISMRRGMANDSTFEEVKRAIIRLHLAKKRMTNSDYDIKILDVKHPARIQELVKQHVVKKAITDINGHYELKGVSIGAIYLMAQFMVAPQTYIWVTKTQVVKGRQIVDLSNVNLYWP